MRTDCFKCYTRLERAPVRTLTLTSGQANVQVVRVTCPCCKRDYGEDYDVEGIARDPAARLDKYQAQLRAGQARYRRDQTWGSRQRSNRRYYMNAKKRLFEKFARELRGGAK